MVKLVSFCVQWMHRLPRGSFWANDAKCRNFDVDVVDVDEKMTLTIDDVTRATSVDVASKAYVTTDDRRTTRAKIVLWWPNEPQRNSQTLSEAKPIMWISMYLVQRNPHKLVVHPVHHPTADNLV